MIYDNDETKVIDLDDDYHVNIDNVKSVAKVGYLDTANPENSIKPNIKAGAVNVGATLHDNQSTLYTSTEADNGQTSVAGAVSVNIKDFTSNADAYGDLTLSGSDKGNALIVLSNTNVEHPMGVVTWLKDFINAAKGLFGSPVKTHGGESSHLYAGLHTFAKSTADYAGASSWCIFWDV